MAYASRRALSFAVSEKAPLVLRRRTIPLFFAAGSRMSRSAFTASRSGWSVRIATYSVCMASASPMRNKTSSRTAGSWKPMLQELSNTGTVSPFWKRSLWVEAALYLCSAPPGPISSVSL